MLMLRLWYAYDYQKLNNILNVAAVASLPSAFSLARIVVFAPSPPELRQQVFAPSPLELRERVSALTVLSRTVVFAPFPLELRELFVLTLLSRGAGYASYIGRPVENLSPAVRAHRRNRIAAEFAV